MSLCIIAVNSPCVELHLLPQIVRYYAVNVFLIIWNTFPVFFISNKVDIFIRLPFLKLKGSSTYRISVKIAVPHCKFIWSNPLYLCLLYESLIIQEMFREYAHHPCAYCR